MRKLFQATEGHTEWFNELYPTIADEVHERSPSEELEQDVLITIWLGGPDEWVDVETVVDSLWSTHTRQYRRDMSKYGGVLLDEGSLATDWTHELLLSLPDDWAALARLLWLGNNTQRQIAEVYGVSQKTISNWRATLVEMMQEVMSS